VTPKEFRAWASRRGLPDGTVEQLIRLAASPEEMRAAFDAVEPAPPIYTLADIVGMTDEDLYGISPSAHGFVIIGGCPNGDPIAIDVANEPGSVWYIDHETMSERPVREIAIRVAGDATEMIEGLAEGKSPIDYYDAANRQE
jgi:hypothetical protein